MSIQSMSARGEITPSVADQIAAELAEVLDYQHERDLVGEDVLPHEPFGAPSLLPEGRNVDPMAMLLRVR